MGYWDLVDPIWETVSIYDGPDVFLQQYAASPEVSRVLFAAHWCQSEICNGGFDQFFSNSTGVLAPEGVEAFHKIGMPKIAALIGQAMSALGPIYPRDRDERADAIEAARDACGDSESGPFGDLDELFFKVIEAENGGFGEAADTYAASNG
ncbi:MAG: DUF4375 domain-containing protein [Rubrivivax sp.]